MDVGRTGAVGLVLAALLIVGFVAFGVWREQPRAVPPPPPPPSPSPVAAAPPPDLVVSVVGKVNEPGLVTVRPGERVADVLEAAGGAKAGTDVSALNLARKVADGEQIYVAVPVPPGAAEPPTSQGSDASEDEDVIDLNTAGTGELEELPGVGEVTAERIVQWRDENGPFTSVEQLREVDGIGEARFGRLRDLVRV
ncbi:ComEA family DNA-binding protein [Allosaccharopolyspora coralli]|uniref:ComEA family DNA-binding protein n=1 Tax=Allosaccharopolyspora coralli TaxID=2665642 RepID=A0A5Q3Q4H5_9PSEU|nr:ComEA family DNA-binding protein [Allosaccharopolyspora coralli]QGK69233.1 ComEA family DNA-binding protein [Allosaccharopolyspora coralli]